MKHRILAAICAAVVSVSAFSTPAQQLVGAAVTADAAVTVAAPTANLKGGSYYSKTGYYITLSHAKTGAKIYYSLNGAAYKLYTSKIAVTKNSTLKFYAKVNGVSSSVVTYTYKYFVNPTVSLASGTYTGTKTVKLTSPAPNVKFYYTLDGSVPTTKSALYNAATGIKITKSCKLRFIAYKPGWSYKQYACTYTIKNSSSSSSSTTTTTTPTLNSASIVDNYTSKYYYSILSATEKKAYLALAKGIAAHQEKIDISSMGIPEEDAIKIFNAVAYDNPQFFWLGGGCTWYYSPKGTATSIVPIYTRTAAEVAAIKPKVEAAVKSVTAEALKKDTLFERVKYIHDYVVNRTTYTDKGSDYIREAEGVLIYGKALCEGYSNTFSYLCQSIGIKTASAVGTGNGGKHMWNIIQLDGNWYHMDVTFDDPTGDTPICSYEHFCVTEKQILKNHTIDRTLAVPAATATKYNYYTASGITLHTNVTTAYNALVKAAVTNYNKGIKETSVYCDPSIIKALNSKVESGMMSSLNSNGIYKKIFFGYVGSEYTLTIA